MKKPIMRSIIFCLVAIAAMRPFASAQISLSKQETKRAEMLVLGTYHMANPGHDIFNLQADDVRSPKRQQEIAELIAALKKFNPTKIAIEHGYEGKAQERYQEFLAGQYVLAAEETDQIGFRLATDLGHKTVYPVNEDGDFPWQRVVDYAKATGQSAQLRAIAEGGWGEMVRTLGQYLKTHTVLQTLLYVNSDARVAQDVGYYHLLARFGEPGDYAGPDLLAEWYRRNIRIYNNVMKLVTSPEDRILVIYGYGHLGWLRQDFAANPTLRLLKLEEFAP